MIRHSRIPGIVAAALVLTLMASTAFAQGMGQVRGRVMDEAGQPVAEADVTMEFVGDVQVTVTFKTNTRGEFVRSGLRTGTWRLQAVKGELVGRNNSVQITISNMTNLEPIIIKVPVVGAGGLTDTSGMTPEEVEARNKLMESLKADFAAGDAMLNTDPDGAIVKFMAVAEKVPQCAVCYTRVGDAQIKKKDEAAAEAAYLKAIEFDPKLVDPYSALAGLYNQQKKFAEAAKMSAKVNELDGGGAAGGGNAAAVLNQGIIHWNAGEYPEAKAQFERATKLDPKLADAFYRLGMANVNLGQLPDAVKAFEEYLKLAPEGEHAEITKGILKSIKGDAPRA
jgi:tetratricopeptide (TPR) repeat protein